MRLADLAASQVDELTTPDAARIEGTLGRVESALGGYDATVVAPGELRAEFGAMVRLYRAVREADARMQSLLRTSEVGEQLLRVYYALRTTQASLAMRYAVEGRSAEAPEPSPVGTAIGLFDAPKVLAQQTHLLSGSYDADLPGFVAWMIEIWTDMQVRRADYLRFYGDADIVAAAASLHEMLDLDHAGEPLLRDFSPHGAHDPAALIDRLTRWAGDGADLVSAARAIQETGQAARSSLLALLAHRESYRARLSAEKVDEIEARLSSAIGWRYPVGETPLLDLAAEQDTFDDLLARVPGAADKALPASEPWWELAEGALRRACIVEQSLRDHTDEYRSRYRDRSRRSFRWYVWEFLGLLDRANHQPSLGVRGPRASK